jgi:hypothetical protein
MNAIHTAIDEWRTTKKIRRKRLTTPELEELTDFLAGRNMQYWRQANNIKKADIDEAISMYTIDGRQGITRIVSDHLRNGNILNGIITHSNIKRAGNYLEVAKIYDLAKGLGLVGTSAKHNQFLRILNDKRNIYISTLKDRSLGKIPYKVPTRLAINNAMNMGRTPFTYNTLTQEDKANIDKDDLVELEANPDKEYISIGPKDSVPWIIAKLPKTLAPKNRMTSEKAKVYRENDPEYKLKKRVAYERKRDAGYVKIIKELDRQIRKVEDGIIEGRRSNSDTSELDERLRKLEKEKSVIKGKLNKSESMAEYARIITDINRVSGIIRAKENTASNARQVGQTDTLELIKKLENLYVEEMTFISKADTLLPGKSLQEMHVDDLNMLGSIGEDRSRTGDKLVIEARITAYKRFIEEQEQEKNSKKENNRQKYKQRKTKTIVPPVPLGRKPREPLTEEQRIKQEYNRRAYLKRRAESTPIPEPIHITEPEPVPLGRKPREPLTEEQRIKQEYNRQAYLKRKARLQK